MALLSHSSGVRGRRAGVHALACPFLCLAFLLPGLRAQVPNVEYRVKSAYIFNFAKFVTWPTSAFASPEAPIVIGIIGKDPFGGELEQTIAGKLIEKRALQVKRLGESNSIEGCQILFVGAMERKRLAHVLQQASKLSILTVGEIEDVTESGAMIRFIKRENNIRFEVDLDAAEAAGLRISSKLLQVAIVKGKPPK